MHFATSLWSTVTYLAGWVTLSPFSKDLQQPLPIAIDVKVIGPYAGNDYPDFKPPGRRLLWKGSEFNCTYPDMPEWEFCSTPGDRSCWLQHPDGRRYDTHTNYEIDAPRGIDRYYEFEIRDGTYNADGLIATDVKLVNKKYPGPWIQACWGDRIIVNVTNKMAHNGTAIHWHGIRQNISTHMDGVPGITQCPIAPNDSFVYNFSAVQYGSSWYHSHYSVQYADGLLGPMTIHGPSTASYDEAKPPLLMTDWFHKSAFQAIHKGQKVSLGKPSILLNGTGDVRKYNYNVTLDGEVPAKYTLHFEAEPDSPVRQAKKYLLRLINTSFDTAFLFSIDHHKLQIVTADFVPIEPYTRSNVLLGIGQRYNVIVEAEPKAYPGKSMPTDGNFWIRTTVVKCFNEPIIGGDGYDRTGVLRYNHESKSDPTSKPWYDIPDDIPCRDEVMEDLKPRLRWTVKQPANGKIWGEDFDVKFNFAKGGTPKFPLGKMSFEPGNQPGGWNPLQIDYENPVFLHLDNLEKHDPWPKSWVIVPENYTENDWVYLALAGVGKERQSPGAHPIHLHGHDFALLQQESEKPFKEENLNLMTENPPRRDVVLLPDNGFAVIAFKADNPGNWIMHCHIAFHASWGLALQILERQEDADRIWPKPDDSAIKEAQRVCYNWKQWQNKCQNWWPGYNATLDCYPACPTNNCSKKIENHVFMDDSGI